MARIFISYSRADELFVERFLPLAHRMFPNDVFWYDDHITGGEDWWQRILLEIAQADLFIYLLSNESLESNYCQAEFKEAQRLHKQILPVIVRRTQVERAPDDIEAEIRRLNWVDMTKGFKDVDAYTRLQASIGEHLRGAPISVPTPITLTPVPEPIVSHPKPRRVIDWRWMVGVILIPIIVALIGILPSLVGGNAETPTPSPEAAENATDTLVAHPSTEAAVIVTSSPAEQLALTPQTSNEGWQPYERNHLGTTMVLVPVGSFIMGSDSPMAKNDEKPTHQQDVTQPFWIDKYEVTHAQFVQFLMDQGGLSEEGFQYLDEGAWDVRIENNNGWQVIDADYAQHPVIKVTWFGARDYCLWRGGHLPTELEWEYAASGPSNWEYPWGDEWDPDNAVWNSNRPSTITDVVGSKPDGMSWVGAMDMAGNVFEWVTSLSMAYPYDASHEDDTNLVDRRLLRGGSWNSDVLELRTANHWRNPPTGSDRSVGFRCVWDFGV